MKYEEYSKTDLALKEFVETLEKVPDGKLYEVYTELTRHLKNL